jgi:AcrR family transcriptional regulator
VGYRHSASEILDAAIEVSVESGLGALTFSRVAEALGISDRMVVYYFPTKVDLILGVAERLGSELQELLAKAFGDERRSPEELLALAWPVLATRRGDRVFALFFEMIGLASSGQEPYPTMVRGLMDSWRDWLAERVVGDRIDVRRRRALSVMARIDGLLLIRRTMGNDAANHAARELGIT